MTEEEANFDFLEEDGDLGKWLSDPVVGGILVLSALGLGAIAYANFVPQPERFPREKNFYIPVEQKEPQVVKKIERQNKPLSQILAEKRVRGELVDRENYIYYIDPRTKEVMRKNKDIADYLSIAGNPVEE